MALWPLTALTRDEFDALRRAGAPLLVVRRLGTGRRVDRPSPPRPKARRVAKAAGCFRFGDDLLWGCRSG